MYMSILLACINVPTEARMGVGPLELGFQAAMWVLDPVQETESSSSSH